MQLDVQLNFPVEQYLGLWYCNNNNNNNSNNNSNDNVYTGVPSSTHEVLLSTRDLHLKIKIITVKFIAKKYDQ